MHRFGPVTTDSKEEVLFLAISLEQHVGTFQFEINHGEPWLHSFRTLAKLEALLPKGTT